MSKNCNSTSCASRGWPYHLVLRRVTMHPVITQRTKKSFFSVWCTQESYVIRIFSISTLFKILHRQSNQHPQLVPFFHKFQTKIITTIPLSQRDFLSVVSTLIAGFFAPINKLEILQLYKWPFSNGKSFSLDK